MALHSLAHLDGRVRAVVLVQPTSPLVTPADVAVAVARFDVRGGAVVGVSASHPADWHVPASEAREAPPAGGTGLTDRVINGAVYVIDPELLATAHSFRPAGRWSPLDISSDRAVDVDTAADLALANFAVRNRSVTAIDVDGRRIGDVGTCFVIAEIGVNHNGDVATAHALIEAAADAGADAVKFQTFDPALIAAATAPLAAYQRVGLPGADSQRSMLAGLALSADAHVELQRHAVRRGMVFLSSPFDAKSVELLDRLQIPAFKVPSGELTNLPYLAQIAALGRPMLVSTGMADLAEVADAVDIITAAGNPPIALLHCVSAYPAEPGDANLAAMATLRDAFAVPTGWSDHTADGIVAIAAAARGAALIEKHLTLDRGQAGPDHRASLEPTAFAYMVAGIRTVLVAVGDGVKRPTPDERSMATVARKSLHWHRSMARGDVVAESDIVIVRPGDGLPPAALDAVVGLRLATAVKADTQVLWTDVETGV